MRVLPGRYKASCSLEILYDRSDAAYLAVKAAMRDGELIKVRRWEDGTDLEEADALITSLSEAAPDQDVVTCSLELSIDGEWAEVGS